MTSSIRRQSAKRTQASKTGEAYINEWDRDGTIWFLLRLPKSLDPKRRKFTFHTLAEAVTKRDAMIAALETAAADRAARGDSQYPITFAEAATRYCDDSTLSSVGDIRSQLKRYANPAIGHTLVASLTHKDVNAVLASAAKRGRSRQSVIHLKNRITSVIMACYDREQITSVEFMSRVKLPEFAASATDQRPREMLTDDEFGKLVSCEKVLFEMRVMAVCSRTLGGMRVSDLHALSWDMIDTTDWLTAFVPRPKTAKSKKILHQRHSMPEIAVRFLKEWWLSKGRPQSGLVFGTRRRRRISDGRAVGDKRRKGVDYARRLRKALIVAGVTRHAVHNDTPVSRACDFHSFRRAFCTGIAASGVNVQTAMSLAGHSSASTHQRYVQLSQALTVPADAIPTVALPVRSGAKTTG